MRVLMVVVPMLVAARGACGGEIRETVAYSELKTLIARGEVGEVTVAATDIEATLHDGRQLGAVRIEDPNLLADLERAHVKASGTKAGDSSLIVMLLTWVLPLGLILFLMLRMRRVLGRGPGGLAVGQSRPKLYAETEPHVRFEDVAGVDEAKEELREVIEYLRTPVKFEHLGGHIPKGILLVGPPGTGKTLLARAVAGEAAVPFFSINGSEFVEMFVGVGAARVRDLFAQARERAPCIIFIDELDALGKVRGMGPAAHEEREQTLNQLLVEMDGFDPRTGIIMMAATNRPEILDPALLRSGRFDRHVLVDRPDLRGRLAILQVHARKVRLAHVEDLATIAQMTPGLVGADLANVVNEAALLAARRGHEAVRGVDLEEAVDRIEAGLEKKNRILSASERERVAHHEVGHALVALSLPRADPVQKISIIPRGVAALGYTRQVPTEERFLMTQGELEDRIAILLGGRVAEDLCFHEPSTGAEDDLRKATDIARSMVRAHGMNRRIGLANLEPERRALWIDTGGDERRGHHSEHVQQQVDAAVARLLEKQRRRVSGLLAARIGALEAAAAALLLRETLSGDELRAILAEHDWRAVDTPAKSPAIEESRP